MTPTRALAPLSCALCALGLSLVPSGCGDDTAAAGGSTPAPEPTLSAPATLVRDVEGVVHIYAKTNEDGFYASGYAQARDRLFQMELQKRRFQGRQAELLGADKVGDDKLIRALDLPAWGRTNEQAAREQTPEIHALIRAWTAGVNRRIAEIESGQAPMPLGFSLLGAKPEHWEVADPFIIGKGIVFGNANQLEYDLLASLIQKYNPEAFASVSFYAPLYPAFILRDEGVAQSTSAAGAQPPGWSPGASSGHAHGQRPALPADAKDKLLDFSRRMAPLRPGASNNWAIAPSRTDTGRSLIAGDPHQALRSPSLMWLSHLETEQGARVAGFNFVGTPGISIGHNQHLVWTATTNYPDVTDIWDVETDGAELVRVGDDWVPVTRRTESIAVRGEESRAVEVEVVGDYGVLLPTDIVPLPLVDSGHRLLFNWTGYRETFEPHSFFGLARAQTLDEFDEAVDGMTLGSFNFVAARADGITYRSSPLVPDRGDPQASPPAYRMLPGDDASTLWRRYLPLEKMPSSRAPASGILVSANNDPFGFSGDGDLTNDPYYFGAYFDPGTRAARARGLLEELGASRPLTLADMQAVQSDTLSLLAAEIVPMARSALVGARLDRSLAGYLTDGRLERIVRLMEDWDLRMERDRVAPVAFQALLHFFARQTVGDDLGIFFEPVLDSSPVYIMKFTLLAARDPNQALIAQGKQRAMLDALVETANFLEGRYGAVDSGFTWADAHETHFESESLPEFDGGRVATDGAEGCVNVSEGRFFDGSLPAARHVSRGGAIYRMTATFDPDGTPRAFINMPRGTSGEPGNEFYDNRTADWLEDRYTLLRFTRADVDLGTHSSATLAP